jgi:hypothetical protein
MLALPIIAAAFCRPSCDATVTAHWQHRQIHTNQHHHAELSPPPPAPYGVWPPWHHQSPIHPRPLQRRSGPCQHTYVQIPQRATPRPEPTSGTELFPFLTRAKCILVHWNFLPIAKGLLDSSSACSCHVYDPVVCTSIPQNVKSTRNVGVLQKLGPDKQVRYRSSL